LRRLSLPKGPLTRKEGLDLGKNCLRDALPRKVHALPTNAFKRRRSQFTRRKKRGNIGKGGENG